MRFPRFSASRHALFPAIFIVALAFRFLLLIQYTHAPNFTNPIGDSKLYVERGITILSGRVVEPDIPFHSSPLYPYIIAVAFGLSRHPFFFLRFLQILMGALNCVLIALLARKLSGENRNIPLFAGLIAALYPTLAFFDLDLLMISWTLLFTDAALLLLIRAKEHPDLRTAAAAGALYGLAALDKVNLLLFVPFGILYLLLSKISPKCLKTITSRSAKCALSFTAGVLLVLSPVTLHNLLVGHDFVLVSSNGGVNLFIGNNPQAKGTFDLPAGSGLSNLDLHGSSVRVAEKALGRTLKPSSVSRYWAKRAWRFIETEPLSALRLLGRKFILLWNRYEIPNHLDITFMGREFLTALTWTPIGFGLVAPFGLLGLLWLLLRPSSPARDLLLLFSALYILSLLPFFITARYRLPLVPILIAAGAWAVGEGWNLLKIRGWRSLVVPILFLFTIALFVNLPRFTFGTSFNRVGIGVRYLDRAIADPARRDHDLAMAILQLKWAVESNPVSVDAHYNLGRAFEIAGAYAPARMEFQQAHALDPERKQITFNIADVTKKISRKGPGVPYNTLPLTPFEQGYIREREGKEGKALAYYESVLNMDPEHLNALSRAAGIYEKRGEFGKALRLLKRAVRVSPGNLVALNQLADLYEKMGMKAKAERLRKR